MTVSDSSPSARALAAAKQGDWASSERILASVIEDVFGLRVAHIRVSKDPYSLNSLNGFVHLAAGEDYFFKFHHEEGEEITLEELYRGEILVSAGYPVDMPVKVSREVGKQLLLYKRRTEPRFSDVCETQDFDKNETFATALAAQERLDELTCAIYLQSLHAAGPDLVAAEPVNQLFHHRLVTPPDRQTLGGRARRFFYGNDFEFPGVSLRADALRAASWVCNGVAYRDSIDDLLARSLRLLEPRSTARFGAVVAHGDAHNANVWFEQTTTGQGNLVFFDPAFAGSHMCALLAEVKATFHNIFAHPRWLYSPTTVAEKFRVEAAYKDGTLTIDTDWDLSELRKSFLRIKGATLWRPLLRALEERALLPDDWRETLRTALFCCPTLVMDLRAGGAGGHTPASSALGLAVSVMVGSEQVDGSPDAVTAFLDDISP
jgi:hypothetical protein